MPVKLVRYTYKTDEQEWNTRETLTPYQQLAKDNYKEHVIQTLTGLMKEESVVYEGNVCTKAWWFEDVKTALAYWNTMNDMSNEFVKAYKESTSNSAPGYVQHKIETRIEEINGTVIATIQAKQA
jgi:hypothetical protein